MPKLSKIKSNFKIATLNLSGISKVSLFSKKSNEKYDIDDLLQINKTSLIPALRCPYSKETTLHYAIRSHAPYEVIRSIVDNHPENLRLKDINGSYPVHLVRDPHVPTQICEYVYKHTRKILQPHEIPLESMILCNTPTVDVILNSPLHLKDDEYNFRIQDISTVLQRVSEPSRVLVTILNRSYRTIGVANLVKCLFEAIDLGCKSSVISILTSRLSSLRTDLNNALQHALNKFKDKPMTKDRSMVLLLLLLADPAAIQKIVEISSHDHHLEDENDVYELLTFLMKMKTSSIEESEANRLRSFKAASLIREHFGKYKEPAISHITPSVQISKEEKEVKNHTDISTNPPCENFELDLSHPRFNMCRHCARALLDHTQHRTAQRRERSKEIHRP